MNYCSDIRLQNTADFVSDFSAHATRAADFRLCNKGGLLPELRPGLAWSNESVFMCVNFIIVTLCTN